MVHPQSSSQWSELDRWVCHKGKQKCVRFGNWEDPLEKEMATHSNTLVWELPWIVHGITNESDVTQ